MKILQMNVWTRRMKGAIQRFLSENDFDIICLQEAVWSEDIRDKMEYFCVSVEQIKESSGLEYDTRASNWYMDAFDGRIEQGIVILSRFPIVDSETKLIKNQYGNLTETYESGEHCYYAQKAVLENGLVVVNYHGYWQKNEFGNEDTVACMRKVADMIRDEQRPIVMCGDLNIVAASPAMRELDFLHDLTAENGVTQTLQNLKFIKDVACDHILVNDQIKVNSFNVHDQLVSDHKTISADVEII